MDANAVPLLVVFEMLKFTVSVQLDVFKKRSQGTFRFSSGHVVI